jgi:cobalt transporter subunit CbtB
VGANKGDKMTSNTETIQQIQAQPLASTLAQNIAALTFGVIIIFAVGFLPVEAAHNAAHDTRHALSFPCH